MKHPRTIITHTRAAFALALLAGMGASQAFAQIAPDANSPINGNAALQFIETKLTAPATLVVAPGGANVATDAQIGVALAAAVQDEIENDGFSGTLEDLIREISKYRPLKIDRFIGAATSTALSSSADATARELNIEAIARAAAGANPKDAAKPVGTMLKIVAAATVTDDIEDNADDAVREAIIAAENFADKITAAAMRAVQKAPADEVAGVMQAIAFTAVNTVFSEGAGYLGDEVAKALSANTKAKISHTQTVDAIFTGATVPATRENVALIAAGLMAGAGGASADGNADEIADAVNALSSAYGGFDAYIDAVAEGSKLANNSINAQTSAAAIAGGIAANSANLAGYITGAGVVRPGAVQYFIKPALDASSGDSVALRMAAGVGAAQSKVGPITVAAMGTTSTAKGEVMQGAVVGLAGNPLYSSLVRTAVMAGLKALSPDGKNAANTPVPLILEVVGFGVDGAEAISNPIAISDITFAAARVTRKPNDVVSGAFGTVAAADQWRAVLGAMAAAKKTAPTSLAFAKGLGSYNAALNDSPLDLGAAVVQGVQGNVRATLDVAVQALVNANTDTNTDILAVLTGAGLVNNRAGVALGAAALKYTTLGATPAGLATLKQTIVAMNPRTALATEIGLAAAAYAVTSPADLFDYVEHTTFSNGRYAVEIATGAAVAAPHKANITAYAAVYRQPLKGARIAGAVLNSVLGNSQAAANIDNQVAAAAAISAGITSGILQAQLGTKEEAALKSTISAAVRAVLAKVPSIVEGPAVTSFVAANGTGTDPGNPLHVQAGARESGPAGIVTGYIAMEIAAGDGSLSAIVEAVLTAATKAAKKHAIAIAQAAAQTARAIIGASVVPDGDIADQIIAAVLNAALPASITPASIANAVNFGINAAANGLAAAGAAGLGANYSHRSVNGQLVTDIYEL